MLAIHFLAVFVAAVAAMVLGTVWYGPLFGAEWAALTERGVAQKTKSATPMRSTTITRAVLMFIGLLLMAFTLSRIISLIVLFTDVSGITSGVEAAFMTTFGLIVPSSISNVLWEERPLKLWVLHCGYFLVALLIMGIIVGAWT